MSRIFYGLAGEGLGHAARVLSIVDRLPDCEVHLFTFGKAYNFLKEMKYPHLHEIDGQMFSYRNGRVSYVKTIWDNRGFFFGGMRRNIKLISKLHESLQPKLFITDFEPTIPRAAIKLGVNCLSIDNQHKFSHCDNSEFAWFLKLYSFLTARYIRWMVPHPTKILISTFHFDKCKRVSWDGRPVLINGLMRKSIEETPSTDTYTGYTLVYVRKSVQDKMIASLADIEKEVRIYGAAETDVVKEFREKPNFKFFDLSPDFPKVLAGCGEVFAAAGNQLISEARFYGKPALVVPEPGQWEQEVNGYYVEKIGLGQSVRLNELSPKVVKQFVDEFEIQCDPAPNGAIEAEKWIRSYL